MSTYELTTFLSHKVSLSLALSLCLQCMVFHQNITSVVILLHLCEIQFLQYSTDQSVAKSKGNVQHSLCMVCYSDQNVLLMRQWIDQMDSDIVSDVHPGLRKCRNKLLNFEKTSLQGQRASASNKLWASLDRGEGFLSFISLGFHNSALMTLLSSLEARFCLTDWIRLNMIDSSKVREVSTEALGTFSVSDQNRVLWNKKKSQALYIFVTLVLFKIMILFEDYRGNNLTLLFQPN